MGQRFDYIQRSFRLGDISEDVLGNVLSPIYGNCYTDSSNFVNDLQGTARKRTGIALFKEITGSGYDRGRIFSFPVGGVVNIVLITIKESVVNISVIDSEGTIGVTTTLPTITSSTPEKFMFSSSISGAVLVHPDMFPRSIELDKIDLFPALMGPTRDPNNSFTHFLSYTGNGEIGDTVTLTSTGGTSDLFTGTEGSIFGLEESLGTTGFYTLWETGQTVAVGDNRRYRGKIYRVIAGTTTGNIPPEHHTDGEIVSDGSVSWLFLNFGIGYVKITSVTSATVAIGIVQRVLPPSLAIALAKTSNWEEGAWSKKRGFPSGILLYSERTLFSSNKSEPTRIWGSYIKSPFFFDTAFPFPGSEAEQSLLLLPIPRSPQSFAIDIAIPGCGIVNWMAVGKSFFIGADTALLKAGSLEELGSSNNERLGATVGTVYPTVINQYLFFCKKQGNPAAVTDLETWTSAKVLDASKSNTRLANDVIETASISFPDTFFGLKKNNTIIFKTFDEGESVVSSADKGASLFGFGVMENNTLDFISICSSYDSLLILCKNKSDGKLRIGTYIHDAKDPQGSYIDLGTDEYSGRFSIPRASVPAEGNWLGGMKDTEGLIAWIEWLDSSEFTLNGKKLAQGILGKTKTGERYISTAKGFATLQKNISPVVYSPPGGPCRIRGSVITFTPAEI